MKVKDLIRELRKLGDENLEICQATDSRSVEELDVYFEKRLYQTKMVINMKQL